MTEIDSIIDDLMDRHSGEDKIMHPLEATYELEEFLKGHHEYIDFRKLASAFIERWKKRNAFDAIKQSGFLVILDESANRQWIKRQDMDARHIRMRMDLLARKKVEFDQAIEAELEYWQQQLFDFGD